MAPADFPEGLTPGLVDAAAVQRTLEAPVVFVLHEQTKGDKRFWSVIDGGSKLDDQQWRASIRCIVRAAGGTIGDVVQLRSYGVVSLRGGESVLSIQDVRVLRSCPDLAFHVKQQALSRPADFPDLQRRLSVLGTALGTAGPPHGTAGTADPPLRTAASPHAAALGTAHPPFGTTLGAGGPSPGTDGPPLGTAGPPLGTEGGRGTRVGRLPGAPRPREQTEPLLHHLEGQGAARREDYSYRQQSAAQAPNIGSSDLSVSVPPALPGQPGYGPVRRTGPTVVPPGSGQPIRAQPYQAQQQFHHAGPVSRRVDAQFVPISALTSFLGNWAVRGRFVNKGVPRPYSNPKGEGKIWSLDLLDSPEENGCIRVTFFNRAVDKFFPKIKENQIYTVRRGQVKESNRKFNFNPHPFEMQVGEDAEITWIAVDDPSIPMRVAAKVVPIADVEAMAKNTAVSVCGVLLGLDDPMEIITKTTGQPRMKQEITIVDDSAKSIIVTFWGEHCQRLEDLRPEDRPTILLEHLRVDEYNGKKLNSTVQTVVTANPQTVEAHRVAAWYRREGSKSYIVSLTSTTSEGGRAGGSSAERVSVAELQRKAIETPEKELEEGGVWFTCRAALTKIFSDRTYYWDSCPRCSRKVSIPQSELMADDGSTEAGPAGGFCSSCNQHVAEAEKRYALTVEIADGSGMLRCQAIGKQGLLLMGGVPAETIHSARRQAAFELDKHDSDFFEQRLRCSYVFRIRAKSERYRDATNIRYHIYAMDSLNCVLEGDPPDAPNGQGTATGNMAREMGRMIAFINEKIPR